MTETIIIRERTFDVRTIMLQSEKDTCEIRRLKRIFWDCNAVRHDYPDMFDVQGFMLDLVFLVIALGDN